MALPTQPPLDARGAVQGSSSPPPRLTDKQPQARSCHDPSSTCHDPSSPHNLELSPSCITTPITSPSDSYKCFLYTTASVPSYYCVCACVRVCVCMCVCLQHLGGEAEDGPLVRDAPPFPQPKPSPPTPPHSLAPSRVPPLQGAPGAPRLPAPLPSSVPAAPPLPSLQVRASAYGEEASGGEGAALEAEGGGAETLGPGRGGEGASLEEETLGSGRAATHGTQAINPPVLQPINPRAPPVVKPLNLKLTSRS
jgi:hypothetical protein